MSSPGGDHHTHHLICFFRFYNLSRQQGVCHHSLRFNNTSDGLVVRASACQAIDSVLIPSQVKSMAAKLLFTVSLLGA